MLTLPLLKVLNQAIAYLESKLTQPVSIAEAAAQVGYSRYHFSRTFLVTTGMTPAAYLRKRRLSEAARQLATSAKPILEVALDYQFQSQEAFSRSFKQEFGVSPGRYRLQRRLRWLIDKITLGAGRLLYPGRGISQKPPIIVPERKLVAAILAPALQPNRRSYLMQTVAASPLETIKIRQAHRQDIPALCRLYHELQQFTMQGVPVRLQSLGEFECYDASWLSNALEKLLTAIDVSIWVAEVQGQVVGLAEVYLRADEPNAHIVAYRYGYLQSLVVAPPLRGRGIGRQLLAAAEVWSKAHGASELRLECWEFEQGPLGFYTQQGYRTLRRTMVRPL
jgi:AraC-like DNA-binding protein/GNAT superfamily N-acetyltransferase